MPYTTPETNHYTMEQQRDRLPLYLREFYETRQLDRIKIDGNEIQGYFEYSFIEEKSYKEEPKRASDGSLRNLNSYYTFLTPRLVIKYNYMHIQDYRKLMTLIKSKNEFVVECYDIVKDCRVRHKMYVATPSMPKIHQRKLEVLGIVDYTIELIGTNVSLDTIEVRYYDANKTLIPDATQYIDAGTEVIINYDYTAPSGKSFYGKWKDARDVEYNNNSVITVYEDLELFAVTRDSNQYTLSFNYGNGNTLYSQQAGAVINVDILSSQTIASAISSSKITLENGNKFVFPENGTGSISVLYEGMYVVPYKFKGWYWTPVANDASRVYGSTVFDYDINRTIYQIYEPISYNVHYVTNFDDISFDSQEVPYNTKVALPALRKSGYTFIGWYKDINYTEQFNGVMPPKNITLYAKWERNR